MGLLFFALLSKLALCAPPTVILVDKSSHTLHLTQYINGAFKIKKTYHATMGRVRGDKKERDDLKTPEGIYIFKSRLLPPTLAEEFGSMALYMNYPNPFDQLAGQTGFDIMLHATNRPGRLKKNFDSKGCIVVRNDELAEIFKSVRLMLTPILIFQKLADPYMRPGTHKPLSEFFTQWLKARNSNDFSRYLDFYHSEFSPNHGSRSQWKTNMKAELGKTSKPIVDPQNILYYRHPKYSVITFSQRHGKKQGTKMLYVAEELGQKKIIAELFTKQTW